MPEHEPPDFEQCAVCGRTMLRGERLWDYVTSGGEPRRVCALCKPRAEAAGWVPAEQATAADALPPRPSRARALRDRLARAAESARPARPDEGDEEAEPRPRRRRRLLVEREPSPAPEGDEEAPPPDPGEPPSGDGDREAGEPRPRPSPDDPHRRARVAVDRFNASEARRTVAGLIRSLGEPHASIELAGRGGATVIVAWELSWYQWEIDPGEHGEVREVRKGTEIAELSDAEREWNARVADDGSLRLSTA